MNIIVLDESQLGCCNWYIGEFVIDKAYDNDLDIVRRFTYDNDLDIVRRFTILYFEQDGKYYTEYNKNENKYIEIPIKTSNNYPYSTGLIVDKEKQISSEDGMFDVSNYLRNKHLDVKINNIEATRGIADINKLVELKTKHENWIPNCIKSDGRELDQDAKDYISWFYRIPYEEIKTEYTWRLVPFVTSKCDINGNQIIIEIPVLFTPDYIPLSYIDKWIETTLPEKKFNDNENTFSNNLGIQYNANFYSKSISRKKVIEWFNKKSNMTNLKNEIEDIIFIRDNDLNYDSFIAIKYIKNKIDELIANGASTYEILSVARSEINLSDQAMKIIKEYLIDKIGHRIKNENPSLTEGQINNLLVVPFISEYISNNLSKITTYGEDLTIYNCINTDSRNNRYLQSNYYDINGYDFYFFNFATKKNIFLEMSSDRINSFMKILTEIMNRVIDKDNDYAAKTIVYHEGYMIARGKIVLLSKKIYDMLGEYLKNKEISIEYFSINNDVWEEDNSCKQGKIFIHNIDLDNVDFNDIDIYYTCEEYDLGDIELTTKFVKRK